MKKLLAYALLLAGIYTAYAVVAPLSSPQIGESPANGRVLLTNGTSSTWIATSSLGIVGAPFVTVCSSGCTYTTDGVADDVQINAALSFVNSQGGGIVHIKPGTYYASSSITMYSNIILEGQGDATKIIIDTGDSISFSSVSSSTLRNIYIDGSYHVVANKVVNVANSDNISILNNSIVNAGGFGIFLSTSGTNIKGKIIIDKNVISGLGTSDVIGGGPVNATSTLTELIISNNNVTQNASVGVGYAVAIDIVAQNKTIITNNITYGNILMGGEKIPHYHATINNNTVMPAISKDYVQIAVTTNSNAGQTDESKYLNITNNQLIYGQIYVQGQTSTLSPTSNVIIANNNIQAASTSVLADLNIGIDLNYTNKVVVSNNIISNAATAIDLSSTESVLITGNIYNNCAIGLATAGTNDDIKDINNIDSVPGRNISRIYSSVNTSTFTQRRDQLPLFNFTNNNVTSNGTLNSFTSVLGSTNGDQKTLSVSPTISQSGSASYTALLVSPIESSLGSGPNKIVEFGTSTNVTLFNILTNGRVGIGTSTPSETVDIWGNLNVGTSSIPVFFANSGTKRAGINTNTPASFLSIVGTSSLSNTNTTDILVLERPFNSGVFRGKRASLNVGAADTVSDGPSKLDFKLALTGVPSLTDTTLPGVTVMSLLGNGVVGIGSSTPAGSSLVITGSSTLNPLSISSSTGSTLFSILANGNVGVGTSTPTVKLSIPTTDGASAIFLTGGTGLSTESVYINMQSRARFGYEASRSVVLIDDKNTAGVTNNKPIVFDTNATERVRITTAGLVGIGTTTPLVSLQVATTTANATTTIEFGRAGQNKGTCEIIYANDGTKLFRSYTNLGIALVGTASCQ